MRTFSIAWASLILLAPYAARATTFIDRPFPESVKDAPAIVRGLVGKSHAEWASGDDKNQRIYTYYEIAVSEAIKGDVERGPLQIRVMGGEKDGVGMQVSGSPQFSAAEEVVVFLGARNQDRSRDLWGLMMGKFQVIRDPEGKDRLEGPGLGQGDSRTQSKWTLASLRKVVAEQDGVREIPVVSKTIAPPASPAPEAPQLQPSPIEGSPVPDAAANPGIPSGIQLLLGCMLGVAGFLLARWILSSKRS